MTHPGRRGLPGGRVRSGLGPSGLEKESLEAPWLHTSTRYSARTCTFCGSGQTAVQPARRVARSCLRPGAPASKLAIMTSSTDSNPEDEYADDEYADYDAEDREQPSTPAEIPGDEPEDDVLEQRQEVPYGDEDR